jgi:transcriptional regulator with XRE-family HTH domain
VRRRAAAPEGRREAPATSGAAQSSLRIVMGKCIQRHRLLSDLTQADLAEKTKMSLKYVGEIERGQANIRLDTLDRLVRGVGWDLAKTLGQGPQTLNDGIRVLMRAQLQEVGQYLDEVVRWLDALQPNQTPLQVTDTEIPPPPHLAARPRRK